MTYSRRDILRMASGLAASTFATSILSFEAFAKSGSSPGPVPGFLDGHFRPVNRETTAFDLPVRGAIPPALSGRYFRNGHNPKDGINPGAWFYGSGMIHGLRISGGRAELSGTAIAGSKRQRWRGSRCLSITRRSTSMRVQPVPA
ncbi:carotenoid oxygenase family protein [Vreelandella sp. F11]|uniref:carotenoid oxygenase family protein n=1 Tax=Vreelandella sp. F11 TaxID=3394751 RepID=UPI0036DB89A8